MLYLEIRSNNMAINVDTILSSLLKLYEKRAALDKQIMAAEKNLLTAVEAVGTVKKAATKKAASVKKAVLKKIKD
jgi:hypothetical protein